MYACSLAYKFKCLIIDLCVFVGLPLMQCNLSALMNMVERMSLILNLERLPLYNIYLVVSFDPRSVQFAIHIYLSICSSARIANLCGLYKYLGNFDLVQIQMYLIGQCISNLNFLGVSSLVYTGFRDLIPIQNSF